MDDKDEIKRLRNLLMVAYLLVLILIIGIVTYGSYELSGVRRDSMILQAKLDAIELIPGAKGIDGKDGETIVGRDGKDGHDGKDSLSTTVIEQVPIKGDQGEKGDTGTTGADGKTVFTRYDSTTGDAECRYQGDDAWQPESECL